MSPFVKVTLVMDGIERKSANKCQTPPLHNGGDSFAYVDGKHTAMLGIPSDNMEAAASSCLQINVLDEPEFALVGKMRSAASADTFLIGSAALSLAQLMSELEQNDNVGCEVKLQLARGDGYKELAGLLRIRVELMMKDST